MVVLIPSFLRNLHISFIVAVSVYILTNSARGFPFLYTLSSIYFFVDFLEDGYSDWLEVIAQCSFDFHFSHND